MGKKSEAAKLFREALAIFQKLVDRDPSLAGLLSSRDPSIRLPASGGSKPGGNESGVKEPFAGKYSPTFVRLEERFQTNVLEIPIGRSRPIGARTDAANDYLQRTDNPGKVILDLDIRTKFGVREHLQDGRLTLYLSPDKALVAINDIFSLKISMTDEAMPEAVVSEAVQIKIVQEIEDQEPSPKPRVKSVKTTSAGDSKPGKGEDAPTRGLPKCRLLTRDGREIPGYDSAEWPEGFNENDGGMIEDLGAESVYLINYDNAYHLKYRKGLAVWRATS